jgi:hypothetical protein
MANSQRQGYLDRAAFHKAMDLIALAQHVSKLDVTKATVLPLQDSVARRMQHSRDHCPTCLHLCGKRGKGQAVKQHQGECTQELAGAQKMQ